MLGYQTDWVVEVRVNILGPNHRLGIGWGGLVVFFFVHI
jgi:hypothetical protein